MAGLSVLLENHSEQSHSAGKAAAAAQIISKATLVIHGKHRPQQVPVSPTAAGSSFVLQLHRCCLCHRELAEGMDIYMYRGDRAFCSEECRHRQIFMDEDAASSCGAGAGAGAATVRGRRRVAGRGRVAY